MNAFDRHAPLLLWGSVLVAGLSWLVLPVDAQPPWPVVLALMLFTAIVVVSLLRWRRHRPRDEHDEGAADYARDIPVILVIGPHAGAVFSRGARALTFRRDEQAAWLYVKTPEDVRPAIEIVEKSHGRLPVAALLAVVPEANGDDAILRRDFSRWRGALDETFGARAGGLPCHVAIYASVGPHGDAQQPRWFGDCIDTAVSMPRVDHLRQCLRAIREQLDCASLTPDDPVGIARTALAQSVLDWVDDVALPSTLASVANSAPFELRGLLLADTGYPLDRASAWARWLTRKTGLRLAAAAPVTQPLPLPAALLFQCPVHVAGGRPQARTNPAGHVVPALAVALAVSFAVSGWNNGRLIERVADAINASRVAGQDGLEAGHIALHELEQRYTAMDRRHQLYEPTAIGWGIYRGTALRAALAEAIRTERAIPDGVMLDGLSLFASGKSTLRPGAVGQLQRALNLILANPDRRVLIAGHTDDVGSSAANQALSEARARAIRDWFIATAGLPPTRFAIQGYGDTRPLASNDNARGRSLNRRVEITLIPDPRPTDKIFPPALHP